MNRKDRHNMLLVIVVLICALSVGSANAGYMGFTADSLQSEDTGGC